jgi:hypothetical protein
MQPGSFAGPPPAPAPPDRVGPSLWWFALAGAIPLAGIIVAIAIVVVGINAYTDRVDGFERLPVPGTSEVTFDATGGYSVYHEHESLDSIYSRVEDPTVTITDPAGNDVDLDDYDTTVTYNEGDQDGEGLWTFEVDEPGTYVVTTDGDPESTVAIGRGIGSGIVATVVGSITVGSLSVIAGIAIAIIVGVRRSQNRNRLRGPLPPPGPPGWGSYGPPPGPYGAPAPGPAYPGGYAYPPGGYGYPPGQPVAGPPPSHPGAGYPPASPASAFPSTQPTGGFPPGGPGQQPVGGSPSGQPAGGFPSGRPAGSYASGEPAAGSPPAPTDAAPVASDAAEDVAPQSPDSPPSPQDAPPFGSTPPGG